MMTHIDYTISINNFAISFPVGNIISGHAVYVRIMLRCAFLLIVLYFYPRIFVHESIQYVCTISHFKEPL